MVLSQTSHYLQVQVQVQVKVQVQVQVHMQAHLYTKRHSPLPYSQGKLCHRVAQDVEDGSVGKVEGLHKGLAMVGSRCGVGGVEQHLQGERIMVERKEQHPIIPQQVIQLLPQLLPSPAGLIVPAVTLQ